VLPSFASQRVTILTPGERAQWGGVVEDWTQVEEETVTCVWYSLSGVETVAGRDVAAGARTVLLEPGTRVSARCRLRFPDGGRDWEIVGEPGVQESPLGGASNVEVLCKRWEGDQ
jgi:hypothetical protein